MNYPDDIRNYDNDPRSPFYDTPTCIECGEEVDLESDCDADGIFVVPICNNENCEEYVE